MNSTSQNEKLDVRLILRSFSLLLFFIPLTFVTAGRLDYWQGWAFNGLNIFFILVTYVVLRGQKDLIRERLQPGKGMKKWDKVYYLVSTPLFFVMFFISVLDAGRFSWTPNVPFSVVVLGCVVYSLGQIMVIWAKKANKLFSSVVRIQADRNQTVCTEGPYRLVRHPGYLGGLIFTLATPFLLGSYWGFIPALIILIPVFIRTYMEDKTLHEELAGYSDYAQKVRYRLIPAVW